MNVPLMNQSPSTSLLLSCLLAVLLTLAALPVPPAVRAAGDIPLTYRQKWLFNASTAGDLIALEQELFKSKGLRVTIKEGGPERDAIRELELGYAQFGVASADQVIRALAKGAPVRVIAQIFQTNPLQWIYRPEPGLISSLAELRGRTIGITYGGNDETIMRALLAKAEISEREVNLFSVRYDYTPFYRQRVDIWPVYRNVQGIIIAEKLRQAGEEVAFFNPADFGISFVANSVVTSEEMLAKDPATVKRFRKALLAGWRQALDPARKKTTLAILRKYDRDTPENVLTEQLEVTRRLVRPGPDGAVGEIDAASWKMTERIMLDQKLIEAPVGVERVLVPFP